MSAADVTLERTLPNSLESERAVLGAIILDDKAIFPATEVLTVEDFYLEAHREIFRAMLALAEEETSIDIFTLREELRRRNKEEAAGGPAYLAALTDGPRSKTDRNCRFFPKVTFIGIGSHPFRRMACRTFTISPSLGMNVLWRETFLFTTALSKIPTSSSSYPVRKPRTPQGEMASRKSRLASKGTE